MNNFLIVSSRLYKIMFTSNVKIPKYLSQNMISPLSISRCCFGTGPWCGGDWGDTNMDAWRRLQGVSRVTLGVRPGGSRSGSWENLQTWFRDEF